MQWDNPKKWTQCPVTGRMYCKRKRHGDPAGGHNTPKSSSWRPNRSKHKKKVRRAERRAREDADDPEGAAGRAEAREKKKLVESFKRSARAEATERQESRQRELEGQLPEDWGPGYFVGDLWISEEEEMEEEEEEEEEEAKEEEEEPEEDKDPAKPVATAAGLPSKRSKKKDR